MAASSEIASETPTDQHTGEQEPVTRTKLYGFTLLNHPRLNKGTAFTEQERDAFDLHGLLPPHVGTLAEQIQRRRAAFDAYETPFEKYTFMRDLQDINETLFYALILSDVRTFMPIVYTPTVGEGCQRFSEIWRKPRGLFLSYTNKDRIEKILSHKRYDNVKAIVVSDGERILGLGDQGAGGMGIPIGKMALYTALGGLHHENCLPVLLDVGTDNEERLANPIYIGWRHKRVRGAEYDDFIEAFVRAVEKRWPHVLLQWEDFAGSNAARLLKRYRDRLCTFNDDIQGTAAVVLATLLAAMKAAGTKLDAQRVAILGFGSAGIGIANLIVKALVEGGLSEKDARSRIYPLGRPGLLVEGAEGIHDEQKEFVHPRKDVEGWPVADAKRITLEEVVREGKITVLIGVAGKAGMFTEEAIRGMAKNAERPVIFPLSNPTSKSEATPADLMKWTNGKALIGTGSPFEPVKVGGREVCIDQTNNSYVFPGLALGIVASRARRVSDAMIMTAAQALAKLSPVEKDREGSLLPPMAQSRAIGKVIAAAVARQAIAEGLSELRESEVEKAVAANVWEPVYRRFERES
ncbi:MAG TPA: NAD-dependent malic enzyme [Acidobacteriaceae bacterium]|jgi:malate dehydrogenase (oxaloacetate-decarboxylating)|nr:NAD-dependent malic enzyme [Acidobacteriaceae bacterium]